MANLQLNNQKNQFSGLKAIIFLFFVILASPLLFFVFNLLMGNAEMFMINGAK